MKMVMCVVAAVLAVVCVHQAAGSPFSLSSDEFPIVMMGLGSRAYIDSVAGDLKCDYVHTYGMSTSTNQAELDVDLQFFDDAAANGIKVMANLRARVWADEPNGLQQMLTCVNHFKDHPALGYWYLFDEPGGAGISTSVVAQYYQAVKQETPGVVIANAHCWSTNWASYEAGEDISMPDYYTVKGQPFPDANIDMTMKFTEMNLDEGEPVIPILQCFAGGSEGPDRFPNSTELRYWVYASMVMGVRGLGWYSHYVARQDDGGDAWLEGTFATMMGNLLEFVDAVEPAHGGYKAHGGWAETYYLGVWDRGVDDTWVVMVNNRKTSETRSGSMDGKIDNADLVPMDGTREVNAQIISGTLQPILLDSWESFVWRKVPLGLRHAPANLQATGTSATRIDVTWTCAASGETGFKIDRQRAGETNWVRIGTAPNNATRYRDCGLEPHSVYVYRVKAYVLGEGNGLWSSEVSGATLGGIDVQPAAGEDDAEEAVSTGNVGTNSLDLDLGGDGPLVGIRFPGVSIPQGATIGAAHLQFTVDEPGTNPTVLTVRGQAIDDAPAFAETDYNISARATTGASVDWDVPSWLTVGGVGPSRRTPDLSGIVQALVDRSGWVAGNALALIISGSGARTAVSYDQNPTNAPYLHICYSTPRNFVAYNDLAWFDGQLTNRVTRYTTTRNYLAGDPAGHLVDHDTGETLAVHVCIHGGGSPYEGQGLHPVSKTDAHIALDGKVDGDGAISYADDDLVLTMSGLNAEKRYEFVLYSDRNGAGYTGASSRYQHATLSGADSFVNASTPGTTILTDSVSNDTTKYNAGYNNTNGYVTRFANIDPGADGMIVVTVARDAGLSYYTYANVFMLAGNDPVKVAKGATWAYRKGIAEASDPATAWRGRGFDDTGWSNGVAPFGYGDGPYGTTLDDMQDAYMSVFLRTPFTIDQPSRVSRVELRALLDDGLIAWINGVEVGRTNMATGPGTFVSYDTAAATSINGPDEWILVLDGRTLPSLVGGTNILAVQVFNGTLSSSDLTMDCRLTVAENERVLQDADDDGMSDPWEIDAFGGTSVSNAATEQDFDVDGLLNIQEFIAGTDPDDPADLFHVNVRFSDGKVVVSLDGEVATEPAYQNLHRFYAIEQRSALDGIGLWEPTAGCGAIPAVSGPIAYTNVSDDGLTLYRGRVWLESE